MPNQSLRSHLIRLASEHPEFRKDLLPLITKSASSDFKAKWFDELQDEVVQTLKSLPFVDSVEPTDAYLTSPKNFLVRSGDSSVTVSVALISRVFLSTPGRPQVESLDKLVSQVERALK